MTVFVSTTSSTIVQRVWNYYNVLRNDGVSYGYYLEHLTYLLFLKMDDENVRFLGKGGGLIHAIFWRYLLEVSSRLAPLTTVKHGMCNTGCRHNQVGLYFAGRFGW